MPYFLFSPLPKAANLTFSRSMQLFIEFKCVLPPSISTNEISKLFLDVRDEAHRFAVKNFRSIKRKNLTKHYLQDIKGVGPKTIDKIYKEYGSLEILAKISPEEFSHRCGISKSMCKNIQTKIKDIYN